MEIKISSKSKKVDFEHRKNHGTDFNQKQAFQNSVYLSTPRRGGSFLIIKIQKHDKPSTDQNTPLRARGTMADIYIRIYVCLRIVFMYLYVYVIFVMHL